MAQALNSINRRRKQRPGNDLIYGPGGDGDVTITGSTTLIEDKYYNNLTVNSGTYLVTNGFRVFVKGTLTNNGTIGLPAAFAGETGIGTLVGRVKDGTSGVPKSYVLGESASGTQVSAARLRNLDLVMRGWHIDPTDGFKRIEGADDGTAGGAVAGSAGGTGGTGGSGTVGGTGGAAGGGTSTAGTNGTDGTDGTDGADGSTGATGAGGAAGSGGGMVVIMAKKVTGTGTIRSDGSVGDTGATGAQGAAGAAGTAGTAGTSGAKGNDDLAVLTSRDWVNPVAASTVAVGPCVETITSLYSPMTSEGPVCSYEALFQGMYGTAAAVCIPSAGGLSIGGQAASQYLAPLGQMILKSCSYDTIGISAVAGYYNEVWQDGQTQDYLGGAAGSAGAAGAAGAAGTGGTGGTGETGTTGGEGAVFLITDSDDVPAEMMVGSYATTIVNP
jgi:hypothetical protein